MEHAVAAGSRKVSLMGNVEEAEPSDHDDPLISLLNDTDDTYHADRNYSGARIVSLCIVHSMLLDMRMHVEEGAAPFHQMMTALKPFTIKVCI